MEVCRFWRARFGLSLSQSIQIHGRFASSHKEGVWFCDIWLSFLVDFAPVGGKISIGFPGVVLGAEGPEC